MNYKLQIFESLHKRLLLKHTSDPA